MTPQRLLQCRDDFPGCRTYSTAEELGRDAEIAAVIVATPPDSHARLAIQLLQAGKHVVCEKPLCLTRAEAETMQKPSRPGRHGVLVGPKKGRQFNFTQFQSL